MSEVALPNNKRMESEWTETPLVWNPAVKNINTYQQLKNSYQLLPEGVVTFFECLMPFHAFDGLTFYWAIRRNVDKTPSHKYTGEYQKEFIILIIKLEKT